MSSIHRLGWNDFFQNQLGPELSAFTISRVVEEQRRRYRLAGDFDGWAEVSGRFRHEARTQADFPAVGDWVGTTMLAGAERAVIHHRLARRGAVSRKAAGRTAEEQVIAANVDTLFLVTAPTGDVNPRRLERYLAIAFEAGAMPVVVLNKSDLCDDPSAEIEALRARLPFVEIAAVSALNGDRLDELAPFLKPGVTVAMLGSSGVGKSTLMNRLLGQDLQRVAPIGASDSKGRHTTTARQLIELPNGTLLIDTPGMRELQPWADDSGNVGGFEDVIAVAASCRFSDCSHTNEPGCAVAAALAAGTLTAERLDHYRQLLLETAFEERKRDKAAAAEEKRKWKRLSQQVKALYKDRERS